MAFQQNIEMNSSIHDLTNCQICFYPFGSKEYCPRMLSCGHTFCHSCLQRFISERSVCPNCKNYISFCYANDIPINFSVKSFSETISKNENDLNFMKTNMLKKIKVVSASLEEEAKMLNSKLDNLNRKQYKLNNEIKIVEADAKETKSKIDRNKKLFQKLTCYAYVLEKATSHENYNEVDAKVKFFLDENCVDIPLPTSPSILSVEDTLKLTRKDLQEKTFYLMKSDNDKKKYAKIKVEDHLISFEKWEDEVEGGASCVDFLNFINSRITVIDTHKFIKEHMQKLHNPKLPKDRIKFSKLEVKGREVYFDSFETSDGSVFGLEFEGLLKMLECSSVIPAEAFLKPLSSSGGEFVVTTDGGSPRALNFLLLTSGIMDNSYQGTPLDYRGSVAQGGFNKSGFSFPGVVVGIENRGIYYRNQSTRGNVLGFDALHESALSIFSIWRKDTSDVSIKTFGRVRRGMEVVDEIRNVDCINECGLLLNLS